MDHRWGHPFDGRCASARPGFVVLVSHAGVSVAGALGPGGRPGDGAAEQGRSR
ncbi:hypothetical protein CSB93_1484 [Pseudomonas paraeruginosa]|uniref:Uncharacterized protein n=1 Tax=Pseudomonas paraeruginosa TaxID=2994495 RepID=A0A2R3ITT1_9PSED|nr:hypothetical protein CSB93_1484 [Pseudomonas paraeruginosa]AWE93083.1 hypothetical protein CSC28_0255 [Pseudomonas paraeruginosa]PTC39285.1 hypothetical protein CLJ1_0228 [Pseudomonas aeruginosa]